MILGALFGLIMPDWAEPVTSFISTVYLHGLTLMICGSNRSVTSCHTCWVKISNQRRNAVNFVFLSPHFPHTYWMFCDRLKARGVNVLGIGDAPYEELSTELKDSLGEYYKVNSLENYDEVYRAVAFFAFKYGKIDWIESMNEYWLETDARLRTDFNVNTGIKSDRIDFIKEKSLMKKLYLEAGIPTARQHIV